MIEKAKRTYATEIEGKTAVVLVGDQGAEIGFPAVGLSAVFENAKRLAMAYDSQHNRASEEWKFVLYNHPSSWNLGCACRKSNSDIMVMQSTQDRTAKNVSGPFDGA
jgi:hypothetical protein